MNDSDARIARLLQAAATLYTSGHVREDAVHVAMKLEEQVVAALGSEKKTQGEVTHVR
jgi:predicted RNA-binding protein